MKSRALHRTNDPTDPIADYLARYRTRLPRPMATDATRVDLDAQRRRAEREEEERKRKEREQKIREERRREQQLRGIEADQTRVARPSPGTQRTYQRNQQVESVIRKRAIEPVESGEQRIQAERKLEEITRRGPIAQLSQQDATRVDLSAAERRGERRIGREVEAIARQQDEAPTFDGARRRARAAESTFRPDAMPSPTREPAKPRGAIRGLGRDESERLERAREYQEKNPVLRTGIEFGAGVADVGNVVAPDLIPDRTKEKLAALDEVRPGGAARNVGRLTGAGLGLYGVGRGIGLQNQLVGRLAAASGSRTAAQAAELLSRKGPIGRLARGAQGGLEGVGVDVALAREGHLAEDVGFGTAIGTAVGMAMPTPARRALRAGEEALERAGRKNRPGSIVSADPVQGGMRGPAADEVTAQAYAGPVQERPRAQPERADVRHFPPQVPDDAAYPTTHVLDMGEDFLSRPLTGEDGERWVQESMGRATALVNKRRRERGLPPLPEGAADPAPRAQPEEPERIVAAAYRIDGKVHQGGDHFAARFEGAKLSDEDFWALEDAGKVEEGFTTSTGRFVNREEAQGIAGRARQVERADRDGLMAEYITDPEYDAAASGRSETRGAADPAAVRTIAGTGAGAVGGAALDDENPLRGAALGAAAGAGAANAPALARGARDMGRTGAVGGDLRGQWYSRLEKAVALAPQEKGTAAQWKGWLSKDVAKGEREWTGVDRLLDEAEAAGRQVTRSEVLDHLEQNRVRVGETVLGGQLDDAAERELEEIGQAFDRGEINGVEYSLLQAKALRTRPQPKFASYTEPGGENYREILVQLENRPVAGLRAVKKDEGYWEVVDADGQFVTNVTYPNATEQDAVEEAARRLRDNPEKTSAPDRNFRSPHFSEQENVMPHLRVKDRQLPNGEKVTFLEEVQDDWAQKGRKQGFQSDPLDTEGWTAKKGAGDPASGPIWEVRDPSGRWILGIPTATASSAEEAIRRAALRSDRSPASSRVPDRPYKNTSEWVELAAKRALQEAVATGADRLSWTTGAQQAERYDLSKQVRQLAWDEKSGRVRAWDHGGQEVLNQKATKEQLPDIVGKEVADRLVQAPRVPQTGADVEKAALDAFERSLRQEWEAGRLGPGEFGQYMESARSDPGGFIPQDIWEEATDLIHGDLPRQAGGARYLEGLDLQVGGEGMKRFYDDIFPKALVKVAKKLGVKLEVEVLPGREEYDRALARYRELGDKRLLSSKEETEFGRLAEQIAGLERKHGVGIRQESGVSGNPSIRITPELREAIQTQGTSLMMGADLPAALRTAEGRAAVGAGAGAAVGGAIDAAEGEDSVWDGTLAGFGMGAGVSNPKAVIRFLRGMGEIGLLDPAEMRALGPGGSELAPRGAKNTTRTPGDPLGEIGRRVGPQNLGAAVIAMRSGQVDFDTWAAEMKRLGVNEHNITERVFKTSQRGYERFLEAAKGKLPDLARMGKLAKDGGDEALRWYEEGDLLVWKEIFGDDAEVFTNILSATSAGMSVPANVTLALKVFKKWKLGQDWTEGILGQHANMVKQGLRGGFQGGPKVTNFQAALLRDPYGVPVDRWMVRMANLDNNADAKITGAQHEFIESLIRLAAEHYDENPRRFMAAMWGGIKNEWTRAGKSTNSATEDFTPYKVQVLAKMAQDPEYSTLLGIAAARSKKAGTVDPRMIRLLAGTLLGGAVGGATSPEGREAEGVVAGALVGAGAANARQVGRKLKEMGSAGSAGAVAFGDLAITPEDLSTLVQGLSKAKKQGGATFAEHFREYDEGGKIATLFSKNIPEIKLSAREVFDFAHQNSDLIARFPQLKLGVFRLDDGQWSIDLNAVFRGDGPATEEALDLARKTDQQAIFDADAMEVVPAGGTGQSTKKLSTEEISNLLAAYRTLGFTRPEMQRALAQFGLSLAAGGAAGAAASPEDERLGGALAGAAAGAGMYATARRLRAVADEALEVGTKGSRDHLANQDVRALSRSYASRAARKHRLDPAELKDRTYHEVPEDQGKEIADLFDSLPSAPNDPAVRASYDAYKRETKEQYEAAVRAGYKFEPWEGEGQPYANSQELRDDVQKNKHVWYFRTEEGFGGGDGQLGTQHPLLENAGVDLDGGRASYNDVFRAIHDLYGHAKEGMDFGPRGEHNAWVQHSRMYSPRARGAMSWETRGQNSWVNFGGHLRRPDGSIPKKGDPDYVPLEQRPFAEQKVGILPAEYTRAPTTAAKSVGTTLYSGVDIGAAARSPGGRAAIGAGAGAAAGAAFASEGYEVEGAVAGAVGGAGVGLGAGRAVRAIREGVRGGAGTITGDEAVDEALKRQMQNVPDTQPASAPGGPPPVPPKAPAGTDDVDPEDFVNVSKFGLRDPGEIERLKAEVTRVVEEQGLSPKEVVPWSRTRAEATRIANQMGLSSSDLDESMMKRKRLSGPEMLAIRNVVNNNIGELERLSKQLASGLDLDGSPLSADELAEVGLRMDRIQSTNDKLLDTFIRARSQTGRDLNNLKILAHRTMDPVVWIAKGQKTAGGPLSGEVKAEIKRLVEKGDRKALVSYVAGLRKASIPEKLATVWKAGLLTGPTTDLANLGGNTMMATLEAAKDVPAYLGDVLLGAVTGVRTKAPPSLGGIWAQARGVGKGAREGAEMMGLEAGARALLEKEGFISAMKRVAERIRKADLTDAEMQKLDFRQVNFNNAILDVYTKAVFKRLGAEDRIFKGAATMRSLYEQAYLQARAEGVRSRAGMKKRIEELLERPSDEMTLNAIAEAEYATFQNRGKLAQGLSGLKRPFGAAGDLVIPFSTTPANIAERVLDYSPIGALRGTADAVRLVAKVKVGAGKLSQKEAAALQKKAVEGLSRGVLGSVVMYMGYDLARDGLMTGDYPDTPGERGNWEATGKQPNAILVDGKWRSLQKFSPVGQMMVVGAQFYHITQDPGATLTDKLFGGVMATGGVVLEMSPLQGVEGLMQAIRNPAREGGRFAEGLARSVVPTIVGRAAQVGDTKVRPTDGVGEAFTSRIPGMRGRLLAKVDVLGREVEKDPGVIANVLDPFSSRRDLSGDDPVVREIAATGAGISALRQAAGESTAEYRERQKAVGEAVYESLRGTISSQEYQRAREEAEALTREDTRLREVGVEKLTRAIQAELIEAEVGRVRSAITREMRRR